MNRIESITSPLDRGAVACLLALSAIAGLGPFTPASAAGQSAMDSRGNANPGVIPLHAGYAGLTYDEWSARWWQWASAYRTKTGSPFRDATGENFTVGQSGPVWFVPGWNYSSSHVREVAVPSGTALLFPCTATRFNYPATDEEHQALVDAFVARIADPVAEVDGEPIEGLTSYLAVSPPFNYLVPPDDIFDTPPGEYGPAGSAGYFILLAPLSVGEHTIRLQWRVTTGPFVGTYNEFFYLTVTPGR